MQQPFIQRIQQTFTYDPETGEMTRNGKQVGWRNSSGHMRFDFERRKLYIHRIAFAMMGHELPVEVDHINGNPSDNRWCNLRPCTHADNLKNSRKRSHSRQPYKGVRQHKSIGGGRWQARISADGREYSLGYFATPEEAAAAYAKAATALHGEFARVS